jgi:alpha-tubulin suppressor-like RCC1 family protein
MNHKSMVRQANSQNCTPFVSNPGRGGLFSAALVAAVALSFLVSAPRTAHGKLVGNLVGWGNYVFGISSYNQPATSVVPTNRTDITAIAGGYAFSMALSTNGTITAWGDDTYGQTNVPPGATNIVAIAAGNLFGLALRSNGTVISWGYGGAGDTNIPPSATNLVTITAGGDNSAGITSNGTVIAWGNVGVGQTNVPPNVTNVVAVAANLDFYVALRADGTVVAWGYDASGQTNVPASATNCIAIAAGGYHAVALKANGNVIAWGDDTYGQTNVPASATNCVAIAAGEYHNVAITANGTVIGWGYDADGQTNSPASITNAVDITAGFDYTLALVGKYLLASGAPPTISCPLASGMDCTDTNGTAADITVAVADQIGNPLQVIWYVNGTAFQTNAVPANDGQPISDAVTLTPDFSEPGPYSIFVTASDGLTSTVSCTTEVYVDTAGDITTWGSTAFGDNIIPAALTNAVAVAAGSIHVVGLSANGRVFTWGDDSFGQTNMPIAVTNAIAIAAGDYFGLALRSDGTVLGWGENLFAVTNVPASASNVVAIAAGTDHGLALRSDGKIIGWGGNLYGEITTPASATNVVAIAAGGYFSLALRTDGRVIGWGFSGDGETNVPASVTNAVAISASDSHALALLFNGTVIGWGSNTFGETTIPASVTNAIGIAAGNQYSLALMSDGTVIGWGDNTSGQTTTLGLTDISAIAAGGYSSFGINALHISLVGPSSTNVECHSTYTDPGATATGSCGVDLTSTLMEIGTVNTAGVGISYPVAYEVMEGSLVRFAHRLVTIVDTTPPVPDVSTLPDIVAQCSTNVTTAPTSTDACAGPISGTTTDTTSFVTQGTNFIHWTYTDGSGNSTTQTQRVIIAETLAPVVLCTSNITVNATGAAGATASFTTPFATNPCADAIVVCAPASGSVFAVGTNTVTCTASDPHGHQTQCTFSVIVLGALDQTVNAVDSLDVLRAGVTNTTRFAAMDIKDLNAALGPLTNAISGALWTDDDHPLTNGTSLVFRDDLAGLTKLLTELRNKHTTLDETTVRSIVNQIVAAGRLTAVVAINDASNNHVAAKLIATANALVARGDAATTPSTALRDYSAAWKQVHPKKS